VLEAPLKFHFWNHEQVFCRTVFKCFHIIPFSCQDFKFRKLKTSQGCCLICGILCLIRNCCTCWNEWAGALPRWIWHFRVPSAADCDEMHHWDISAFVNIIAAYISDLVEHTYDAQCPWNSRKQSTWHWFYCTFGMVFLVMVRRGISIRTTAAQFESHNHRSFFYNVTLLKTFSSVSAEWNKYEARDNRGISLAKKHLFLIPLVKMVSRAIRNSALFSDFMYRLSSVILH
jgi:hypothetical protein